MSDNKSKNKGLARAKRRLQESARKGQLQNVATQQQALRRIEGSVASEQKKAA